MSLSFIMNTYNTPQPPKGGFRQTAVVFISVVTKLKFKFVAENPVRGQFPLPGGQGVREGKQLNNPLTQNIPNHEKKFRLR